MDLILNGETQRIDLSDCANLAELVAVTERLDAQHEASVVVHIEIDGEPLPPEALGELETRSLDGIRRVALERRPTRQVARSVLEQGAEYTKQIARAIDETVGHYRGGRPDLGARLLADLSDSLTVLTGIAYSVVAVLGDEEASALAALQVDLQPGLEQLLDAQSNEDPILIADSLEYEIAPQVDRFGVTMTALHQALDAPGPGCDAGRSN